MGVGGRKCDHPMYDNLIAALRNVSEYDSGYAKLMYDAADAIEAQDRHILTLQLEMMAEAESHIAKVKRLNEQIEELQADVRPVVKSIWKHVQWVVDEELQEGGYWISRCSNCSMPYHTETPFCPHCGADMREES